MKKMYYVRLDILRIFLFISILLYHLNILSGGYLAVCSFFVLSGYLAIQSAFSQEKFNIFKYYYNRFKKIYIPLLIIVFLTILTLSFFSNINWVNLKPETTSVLLNNNNFWQLNANFNYFQHHISSPFTHLWYISILIQFDLVFPFIFIIFKTIGKHISKKLPLILSLITIIISYINFVYLSYDNLMLGYYHTFSRLYALFIGILLGLIHYYYKPLIIPYLKEKYVSLGIFIIYILASLFLFSITKVTNNYYTLHMLLICIITCRIIDYSITSNNNKNNKINNIANITYEGYLVQYPLIYIFSFYKLNNYVNNIAIIILTILISLIIHFSLYNKNNYLKKLKKISLLILLLLTINGYIIYHNTKDHTKELKQLENNLAKNEKLMEKKKKEYLSNQQKQEEDWQNILNNLDTEEEQIEQMVINLPIIGVGDSVMLGAIEDLYAKFPNSYIDAKVSRTDYEANDILLNLKNNNMLGNPIIINLGTNGQCGSICRDVILKTVEDRHIYWVNVSNDWEVHVNDDLANYANAHDNITLIDWNNVSKGHPEYFIADGIHLTPVGRKAYVEAIYNAILNDYIKEFNIKKEETISNHERELKEQITFYGNTLLINSYKDILNYYPDANYIINEKMDYNLLINEIDKTINNNNITYNIVFIFDSKFKITQKEFDTLIDKLSKQQIYVILLNNNIKINKDNVHIIDFQKEIDNHSNYLMYDKKHLTATGNKKLAKKIKDEFNKNKKD